MEAIGQALRSAALDSADQGTNGDLPVALGMVPYPRARPGSVKWLATCTSWPTPLLPGHHHWREPVAFDMVGRILTWLRDDTGPFGYDTRPGSNGSRRCRRGEPPLLVAPIEAWLHAYGCSVRFAGGEISAHGQGCDLTSQLTSNPAAA